MAKKPTETESNMKEETSATTPPVTVKATSGPTRATVKCIKSRAEFGGMIHASGSQFDLACIKASALIKDQPDAFKIISYK